MIATGERYRAYECESCGATGWRQSRAPRLFSECDAPLPTPHSAKKDRRCDGHMKLIDGVELHEQAR